MSKEIKEVSLYELVKLAECGTPDSATSAGALFLESVRDSLAEALEFDEVNDRMIHEIADGAPDVYTHQRWREFVDLCAYHEDIEGYMSSDSTMTDRAGVALYQIAERLVYALVKEYIGTEVYA